MKVRSPQWVVILIMPLRMMPPFVLSARVASGRRRVTAGGVTASVPLVVPEQESVDFESTALDLPLAWHQICRLRARP